MSRGVAQETGKIKLWEKLELVVGEGADAGRYVTRLEDFSRADLVIDAPEFVSGSSLLSNGSACEVIFKKEDAIYQFSSVITVTEQKGIRTYRLRAPERLRRVQRRQSVRIELRRKLALAILGTKGEVVESCDGLAWHETVSANISGGGMLIEAPAEVLAGHLLLLRVDFFPEVGLPIAVVAIVRRVQQVGERRMAGIELLRCDQIVRQFDERERGVLPETVTYFDQIMQNKLVNYVFQEQVKLRQKGLI